MSTPTVDENPSILSTLGCIAGTLAIMVTGFNQMQQMGIPMLVGTKNYCPELQGLVCPGRYYTITLENVAATLVITLVAMAFAFAYAELVLRDSQVVD